MAAVTDNVTATTADSKPMISLSLFIDSSIIKVPIAATDNIHFKGSLPL
jgi:hypothetical protein